MRVNTPAGPDAADAALAPPRSSEPYQSNAPRPLCVLRHCREYPRTAASPWGGEALLAHHAYQPELERARFLDALPVHPRQVSATATKAVSPVWEAASSRRAVNQLSKSVVREICTLRSVGAGCGEPPRPPGGTGNRTKPNRTAVARRKPSRLSTGRPSYCACSRLYSAIALFDPDGRRPMLGER
jgi:hypothetical protein